MLPDSGPSRVSEIAKRMGVGFDIPAFREFLSEKAS